jgi:hypothetical protein
LKLSRYSDFVLAMKSNPALRKDLNVSRWLDGSTGDVHVLPDPLPRANFPQELIPVKTPDESKQRLAGLDPTRQALVPPGMNVTAQDARGTAGVDEFTAGHYRIHYQCATTSLLRVGNAYFPGWTARMSNKDLPVLPVDHALMGVVVPAGHGDLVLDYHSTYFVPAACISLVSLLVCIGLLVFSRGERVS